MLKEARRQARKNANRAAASLAATVVKGVAKGDAEEKKEADGTPGDDVVQSLKKRIRESMLPVQNIIQTNIAGVTR
jgi:hypothetical protein